MKIAGIAALTLIAVTASAQAVAGEQPARRQIEDWRGNGWRHHGGTGMPSPYNFETFRRYWNAQPRCHFDPQWGGLRCPHPLL